MPQKRIGIIYMKIKVNNKECETSALYLSELATEMQLPASGIAIAVNNKMVKRSEWEKFPINEESDIIIIKAACGG